MLRSEKSEVRAFVTFNNSTDRQVEIRWVNFYGENIHFTVLEPGAHSHVNTFCTHPWIFLCPNTGERLQIKHSYVFLPEPWHKHISKAENGQITASRQKANIHYPLKALKDICLRKIALVVRSKDDIIEFLIPHTLKADLFKAFDLTNRFNPEFHDTFGRTFS
ncbi:CLUMA_CG019817, isoform A [Clunio marinus]|uniref:CLUMA_CG019817, isoform A n=1 Tax=Clunio marinus TaxID=568069 RepID=A0A1J1J5W1_9DIPT|nr:CLUMA_CG019817, isoform A [Clunio marinus]